MAINRIGKLYQYTGQGSIPLWEEDARGISYRELGRIKANMPFLIIDKIEDASIQKYWIKVLFEEKVGWFNIKHLNIMWIEWIDPEEHL